MFRGLLEIRMNYSTFLLELSRALSTNNGARVAQLLGASGPAADDLLRDLKETSVSPSPRTNLKPNETQTKTRDGV